MHWSGFLQLLKIVFVVNLAIGVIFDSVKNKRSATIIFRNFTFIALFATALFDVKELGYIALLLLAVLYLIWASKAINWIIRYIHHKKSNE